MKKTKTPAANIKTEWNLGLLYKSNTDPQIEKDLRAFEAAYDAFAAKYSGREEYLKDEDKLVAAIADFEKIQADFALSKPYLYFRFKKDLNSNDEDVTARMNKVHQRYSKLSNKIVFFTVALSKISPADQKRFLASEKLARYRYFLKCIFDKSKHILSEKEEQIMNVKSLPSHSMWVDATTKALGKQTIAWKGKKLVLTEAMSLLSSLEVKERRALNTLICTQLRSVSDLAEAELNAVVTNKKINDEIRGYEKPYSAVVLGYENEDATVQNLVSTVTKHFSIAHRFYKVKAKMLGLSSLEYSDRGARVGTTTQKIPFERAVEFVRDSFRRVGDVYADTFDSYLKNGQIDVFPKAGKKGGAYCWGAENMPTFILLNHLPDFRSATTMAHEMGHALHSEFSSKGQPSLYRDYSTATAEVASTFFENVVFDEIFALLSPQEQIVALHNKLNDSISTIFRQIACFNFELDMHTQIRDKGSLSAIELARLMNKHMSAYLGPLFNMRDDDGFFFVQWWHLRLMFYTYSYAFGEIISSALYSLYKQDKNFEAKIRQFLSAGGSASPEDIFAAVGIDVRNPAFFKEGLKKIEKDIEKLEKLVTTSWNKKSTQKKSKKK